MFLMCPPYGEGMTRSVRLAPARLPGSGLPALAALVTAVLLAAALLVAPGLTGSAQAATASKITGWSSTSTTVKPKVQKTFAVRVSSGGWTMKRPVWLQSWTGSRWATVASTTSWSDGRAYLRWTPTRTGALKMRVAAPSHGSASSASTASRTVKISSGTTSTAARYEAEVLRLVNEARAAARTCGNQRYAATGKLVANSRLASAARAYAQRMGDKRFFDHTDPTTGKGPGDRATDAGYRWRGVGENIAAGYGTPANVVRGWLDSPGHCANIMNPGYTHLGNGYAQVSGSPYGDYWVQMFGIPA